MCDSDDEEEEVRRALSLFCINHRQSSSPLNGLVAQTPTRHVTLVAVIKKEMT